MLDFLVVYEPAVSLRETRVLIQTVYENGWCDQELGALGQHRISKCVLSDYLRMDAFVQAPMSLKADAALVRHVRIWHIYFHEHRAWPTNTKLASLMRRVDKCFQIVQHGLKQ
jgi:hypothetical protein